MSRCAGVVSATGSRYSAGMSELGRATTAMTAGTVIPMIGITTTVPVGPGVGG